MKPGLNLRTERNLWVGFVVSLMLATAFGFWLGVSLASLPGFP
jgi:hypothetical protein